LPAEAEELLRIGPLRRLGRRCGAGRKGFFFMRKNWHLTIQKQAKDYTLSVRPHSDIHGMMACWAAYSGVVCNN